MLTSKDAAAIYGCDDGMQSEGQKAQVRQHQPYSELCVSA